MSILKPEKPPRLSKVKPRRVMTASTSAFGRFYFFLRLAVRKSLQIAVSPTNQPTRVTTKTLSASFSAENYCLILDILGLGKNSSFRQYYLVFGYFLILGTQSSIRLFSERKHASCTTLLTLEMCNILIHFIYVPGF